MNGVRVLLVVVAVGSVEVINWRVRRHPSPPFSCEICDTARPGQPLTRHQPPTGLSVPGCDALADEVQKAISRPHGERGAHVGGFKRLATGCGPTNGATGRT